MSARLVIAVVLLLAGTTSLAAEPAAGAPAHSRARAPSTPESCAGWRARVAAAGEQGLAVAGRSWRVYDDPRCYLLVGDPYLDVYEETVPVHGERCRIGYVCFESYDTGPD